ncbi:MAG: hypothetical protein HYY49_07295 [Ignavibacteriales bacterium]|nr:hypothetical protein [Ignavibacteriales bacterium]
MQRLVLVVLWSASLLSTLEARQGSQRIGQWKNFTDMKTVRALGAGTGALWAATAGGSFAYDPVESAFVKFTNTDGLSSNDLTAITLDQSGAVWVGASDGSINVREAGWRDIRDIAASNRIQRSIKKFVQLGDSMLVVTDFGVSVYVMSKKEFGDTYANFGFTTPPVVKSVLVHGNRIWVATNQGIASAQRGSSNLTSPTAWTRYGGLPSTNTTSLGLFSDTLIVGCINGAAFFSADTFLAMTAFAGKAIVDMEQRNNTLTILSNSGGSFSVEAITHVNSAAQLISSVAGMLGSDLLLDSSPGLWVSTSVNGIARWDGTAWSFISPNGPQSNLFASLAVDDDGVLWVGTGFNAGGRGFYRYDPSKPEGLQWKNFVYPECPLLQNNDYYKVSIGANGSVWASSWGFGVVEVVADTIRRRLHAATTPSLATSDGSNPNYPVIGSVVVGPDGSSWFVNRTATNGNVLARLVDDTTFVYYRNLYNPGDGGFFHNMVIDRLGTKWLGNAEPAAKATTRGLYYFNENSVVSGTEATGGWGYISTTDGLPSAYVLSLAVDATGDVWVGTDLGAMIITDPQFPRTRRTPSFPLREQTVQAIAVDGVNNKWVGTREGVFVLNADGTQLLEQHTVLTTGGKLVSDDVRSVAIDQRRGIVYLGTEKGLSSLNIVAVETKETFADLEVGPNPYHVPNEEQLIIRDLVGNTTVKILTVNGSLVSQFKAQGGGRAFWDGKDSQGRFVSTGIYFIVAFADNGNQIGIGKVAVVRR